ncbi:TonB-dependent receptor [Gramella sp. KN1008]|uniref:TonB-dependent receptor n=1 Tax=Gramella sp. KN1008 TaxID=2529298 RepID=UPI00103F9ED0|nr:TonB-dependent receptor [Gramella sp. KN1008]TBW27759.1 TonB-dependent receptor [Gramella sp. KN1008]
MKKLLTLLFLLSTSGMMAQIVITGNVTDEKGKPISGVNIMVENETVGTSTDFEGEFTIETTANLPLNLVFSAIGYGLKSISVVSADQTVNVVLTEDETQLGEIVVSASRTPERIFESPVSVELIDRQDIQNTASADFYGELENLKGVDINTNSLTFKSVNTRGFATFANTRFVQLVDGMDNSSPALNFVLGNLLGISQLDLNNIELLPGASSALYGANAFNGILFMNSKSPFDFQGLSAYATGGVTSQDAAGTNGYYDVGVRLANKFSDKFAAKFNFSYLEGTDWFAVSEENLLNPGAGRAEDPNYDGLNIYGDEVNTNIRGVGTALVAAGRLPMGSEQLLPNEAVSRTGYAETSLHDYDAQSLKLDAALHYRPFADDFEIIYLGKYGRGSTIYQGTNRYAIKDFWLQQHKLEVRNNNFFVRGYITDEDAGDSYDTRFAAININRVWKSDQLWFGEYAGAFVQARNQGASEDQAHAIARQFADTGRLVPGTQEFKQAFNEVVSDPDFTTGAKFQDQSQLKHIDANYNFSHLTDAFTDIQVGGSFRQYKLNSSGTIFTDIDGPIQYNEYGLYSQIQKKLIDERLKLTGSMRYDKSELFKGQVTPRFSIGYTIGEDRNHNIRASVQTAFRNPTTQDLYIGLNAGRAVLVGAAEDNLDRDVRTFPVSGGGQAVTGSPTVEVVGRQAYENAFSLNSVLRGAPQKAEVDLVQPEEAVVYEIGYRSQMDRVSIDASFYYNVYENFISNETTLVPFYGEVGDNSLSLLALQNEDYFPYQTYTNSDADVKSYGAVIGLNVELWDNYSLETNYTYAQQDFDQASDPDFRTSFNTPKHRVKASFGSPEAYENFGFKLSYRWSDEYFWQATFADGNVPSYSVLDAQVNYTIPAWKARIKLGANNILGDEYFTAYGTGYIGSQYFASIIFNNL